MRAPDAFDALRHHEVSAGLRTPIGHEPDTHRHGRPACGRFGRGDTIPGAPAAATAASRVALWRLTPARRAAWLDEVDAGGLRPSIRVVAAAIAAYAERRGGAFPGVATLARAASVSASTVYRACRRLEAAGLLLRQPRPTPGGAGGRWQWRYHPVVAAGRLDPHDLARMRQADPPLALDAAELETSMQADRRRQKRSREPFAIGRIDRSYGGHDRSECTIVPCTADPAAIATKSLTSNEISVETDASRSVKMTDEEAKPQETLTSHEASSLTLGHAPPCRVGADQKPRRPPAPAPAPAPARSRREEALPPRARAIVVELEQALQKAPALARQPLQNDALRLAKGFDQDLAKRSEAAFAALDENLPGAAREAALAVVRPYQQWARQRNLLHEDGALGLVECRLKTLAAFVRHERGALR